MPSASRDLTLDELAQQAAGQFMFRSYHTKNIFLGLDVLPDKAVEKTGPSQVSKVDKAAKSKASKPPEKAGFSAERNAAHVSKFGHIMASFLTHMAEMEVRHVNFIFGSQTIVLSCFS